MPEPRGKRIEDDPRKLRTLANLLREYAKYISDRERQPLAAQSAEMVREWVNDNATEIKYA